VQLYPSVRVKLSDRHLTIIANQRNYLPIHIETVKNDEFYICIRINVETPFLTYRFKAHD